MVALRHLVFLAGLVACSVGSALGLPPDQATICMQMAAHARKFFFTLQEFDAKEPGKRDELVEMTRSVNYEQFKSNVAKRGDSTARLWEIQRKWGERGINEFVRDPNASPDSVERAIYERCSSSAAR